MWVVDLKNLEKLRQGMFQRLEEKLAMLNKRRPLSIGIASKIKESLSTEWTYHSNAIEGNTLSLNETHVVINHGMTVKGHSMNEHLEAVNHDIAVKTLYGLVEKSNKISAHDVLDLHALILRTIEDHHAGRLRNVQVRIQGANFLPPAPSKVSELFDELLEYINDNPQNLSVLELATVFHHKFVYIHPFYDGNGRAARLITNLYLMRHGYPPMIILKEDRLTYYAALNSANNGNYQKLAKLIARSIERSMNIYISALEDTSYGVYEPINNVLEEAEVTYKAEYVSLLARQGKLDAHKENNVWYTSKEALQKYIANRERKR